MFFNKKKRKLEFEVIEVLEAWLGYMAELDNIAPDAIMKKIKKDYAINLSKQLLTELKGK